MPNNISAKIALDSQPYSDGRRKRRSRTRWIDGVLEDLKALAQWKVFMQKCGQKFFLLIFLIYGVKTMFSMILWDSTQFFGKIRSGQLLGQNLGYNILLTSRNEKYISKLVHDSDLQSLPVVSNFNGDILMTYPTPRLRPPPLPYS
jgi:hypothetical protein